MLYRIIHYDPQTETDTALCYTVSREDAETIVTGLIEQHPEQCFAVVADDTEE